MRCGDAVLIPAPGGPTIPHLWFLITDPDPVFADALIVDARRIELGIEAGTVEPREPCKPELLRLVQQGALASPHTPNKAVAFCRRAWGKGG
ncbi:MAG: hypothetical protein AAB225_18235 [Acidobacteriota bacterium]